MSLMQKGRKFTKMTESMRKILDSCMIPLVGISQSKSAEEPSSSIVTISLKLVNGSSTRERKKKIEISKFWMKIITSSQLNAKSQVTSKKEASKAPTKSLSKKAQLSSLTISMNRSGPWTMNIFLATQSRDLKFLAKIKNTQKETQNQNYPPL